MTASASTAFQANFKIGTDLHNVYADNGGDFIEQLDFFAEEALPKIIAITQTIGAASVVAASFPIAPAATQNLTAAAPPPAAASSDAGAHLCDHAQPMKLIPAGISKATGKPYKAFYACAQPRGMQCDKKVTV